MKLKVNDLYNLSVGLGDLAEKELPIATSLKVMRAQQKVSEELLSADKLRQKIIEKYKEKEVKGGVKIKGNKMDAYKKDLDELMDQGVGELDISKISTGELEGLSVKPRTLGMLKVILDFE